MRVLLLVCVLAACGGPGDPDGGAGPDAGAIDAAVVDGGLDDAGPTDASPIDAGVVDAGMVDAGPDGPDAGDADAGPPGPPCTEFADGVVSGSLAAAALDELSGLAASRLNAGLFYGHNDSGDSARLFVLDQSGGNVGQIELDGASSRDYEDIAVGPGPDGQSWVYVGDHGDNNARTGSGSPRDSVTIYRFAEPTITAGGGPQTLSVTPESITIEYPDDPHDCESLAVDSDTGDVYMLSKEDSGASSLYVLRAPITSPATLELVTTVDVGEGIAATRRATAMDLSPGGHRLLVRSYSRIQLWVRAPGAGWDVALAASPMRLPSLPEAQGEAIAWTADGRNYLTSSEGVGEPVHFFAGTDASCHPN